MGNPVVDFHHHTLVMPRFINTFDTGPAKLAIAVVVVFLLIALMSQRR